MEAFLKSPSHSTFTALFLLICVHAASPKPPAPAPRPVAPRFSVEFQSSPDGAAVEYRLSGGWLHDMKCLASKCGGTVKTKEPLSLPLKNGMTITSIFRLGGYRECRVEAPVKADQRGWRLETRFVEFDQQGKRIVTPGPIVPLDAADSRNPAVISCNLGR